MRMPDPELGFLSRRASPRFVRMPTGPQLRMRCRVLEVEDDASQPAPSLGLHDKLGAPGAYRGFLDVRTCMSSFRLP